MRTRSDLGSALVPSAGEGILPSRTPLRVPDQRRRLPFPSAPKSSSRQNAETSARNESTTRAFLFAAFLCIAALSPSRAAEPDTFSPVVSYQYLDTLAESGTTITSPVISYQYFDWPGDENLTFSKSSIVSYNYSEFVQLAITRPPQSLSVRQGDSPTFSITAIGNGALSYQWFVNGIKIPGATESHLTLAEVQSSQAGGYAAIIKDATGTSLNSGIATLAVQVDTKTAPRVSVPRIMPGSMPFSDSVTLRLSCATPRADLWYGLADLGSSDVTWAQYTGPFVIEESKELNVIAFKDGLKPSVVAKARYIKVAPRQSLATSQQVGLLNADHRSEAFLGGINTDSPVVYYSFDLPYDTDINISLSESSSSNLPLMDLLDGDGVFFAHPNFRTTSLSCFNHYPITNTNPDGKLKAGRYYIRVLLAGTKIDSAGNPVVPTNALHPLPTTYKLQLSIGMNFQIVVSFREAHHIGLLPMEGKSPISPNTPTWVIIHGRSSKPSNMEALSGAISKVRSGEQVLAIDWETAARSDYLEGAKWIPLVANWASNRLQQLGLVREQLNIAAHSWGTYVGYETAKKIGGSNAVTRFIALDPAARGNLFGNFTGYSPSQVNFKANARYSWSFLSRIHNGVTTQYGNIQTAATAANSFVALWPSTTDALTSHTKIVDVFANMITDNPPSNRLVSEHFWIPNMELPAVWLSNQYLWDGSPRPWFDSRAGAYPYETVLSVDSTDGLWAPTSIKFVPLR